MNAPQIELIPLRAAIASDQPTTLDVLVKINPPPLETDLNRPPINLGLIIDRSGSMAGRKIEFARQSASYAVQQLLPTDRVSVTIFDDRVGLLVPSTLVENKAQIISLIQEIQPRGSTALHEGWIQGSIQVSKHLNSEHLNRAILLSDGLANVGETNPDLIAQDVHGLSQRGVSTTTMGVGDDYDEDLLEAMARSGDGNFYHIESPDQLPNFFQAELQGLMATVGNTVSLGIETQNNVILHDVLNDLDKTNYGRLKLPNLVKGNVISIVVRLKVSPTINSDNICRFRLAWNDPDQEQRQIISSTLALPSVSSAQLTEFPINAEVQEQIAILMTAQARQEAVQYIDRGNFSAAQASLRNARVQVDSMPSSSMMQAESRSLFDLENMLLNGDAKLSRKRALNEKYNRNRSRKDI